MVDWSGGGLLPIIALLLFPLAINLRIGNAVDVLRRIDCWREHVNNASLGEIENE